MHQIIHRHTKSFGHAWRGVMHAVSTQPNFIIHLFLSAIALLGGYILQVSHTELIIIVLVISVGLAIELINTAIEEACNAIDENIREEIKIAKDAAAGAMLIYAIGALIIAGIIFLPRILSY